MLQVQPEKIQSMKRAALDLNLSLKKTRKREFLEQMERVVPWVALVALITPYYPEGRTGRPFELEAMLRTHFLQQWFSLSDPAMEEAFFDVPLYREFAQLDSRGRLPDESTILRFRHRLEKHKLADDILATVNNLLSSQGLLLRQGSVVDATLIAAPSSTKNKKVNQWYFGMKAHIGVDAGSGLVHSVRGTAGHVADVTEGSSLLHGEEAVVFADAGYQGADKRPGANPSVRGHVAMRPGKRKKAGQGGQPYRCAHRQGRKAQGRHPCQGRAPVSCGQAAIWLRESALPGIEEKHAAAQDAVCAVEPVDGPAPIDGDAGMSAPESRQISLNRTKSLQFRLKRWSRKT